MASLSLIIPVEDHESSPVTLIEALASKPDLDIEILVAQRTTRTADLSALAEIDKRVRILPAFAATSTLSLWNHAVKQAEGDWVSLIRPDDIFEPEAINLAAFAKARLETVDAITWNILQIAPDAVRGKSSSVAVPTKYDVIPYDKTDILKAFFLWEGSLNVPKLPFGLYHGILSKQFALSVVQTIEGSGRDHDLAQWEWTARTVLMAENFVYCMRPLSVMNITPYKTPAVYETRNDFPFHAGLGLTGGIAEIQFSVFAEMGALWTGAQENFVRGIMIDCMLETDPNAFNDKCNAYYPALLTWEQGHHASLFKPQFTGERPLDKRRGLHGNLLMIDRHIAGAQNAQQFYNVVRNFLVPVGILCGGQAI